MKNAHTPISIDWQNLATTILPQIEEGIAVLDRDGRILYCNTSFLTITRQSAHQVQGQVLEQVFTGYTSAGWLYSETLTKEITYRELALQVRLMPLPAGPQEQAGCVAVIKKIPCAAGAHATPDHENTAGISGRKQAEDALHRNEEQLRLITDSLPVLISYVDTDERYQFINKTYEAWFTVSREKAPGIHIRDLLGEQVYTRIKPHITAALQGRQVSFETQLTYDRVGLRTVNATYTPHIEKGTVKGFYVLVLDITEEKKVQQRLALSEERFRLVSKATNDVIWDWDLVNNSIWWNEGLRVLFGYKPEEVEPGPESWFNRIHPDDMQRIVADVGRVIDTGGEQWSDEYRFRKADGSYAFVLDRGYILHDTQGKSVRMIGSMVDITYMKEAQEALEQQAQELKQSNADLEQFAYISSHDLQEPLNTASSFAKLLARKYQSQLGTEGMEFIDFIVGATGRMKLLIRSLLDYSKINASGKMLEPTDMASAVLQAQQNLKDAVMQNEALIRVGPMPLVQAIPFQMVQLFQHLIGNAIKFRSTQPPVIDIDMKEGENHYLFTVADNGIGMDMKYAGKIFQVFQRLHSRDEYEGAGMGLATCKRIVERHRGLIWVESKAGQGSVFYFTIRK
jgi:PAS domain S-box-containing protein